MDLQAPLGSAGGAVGRPCCPAADSFLDARQEGARGRTDWLAVAVLFNHMPCPILPVLAQEQDVVVAGEGLPFDAMDEDESSEEDEDEDALLPAEEHFALPLAALDGGGAGAAAGLAAAGGGAGGVPPAGGPHAPQVQGSAAETLLRAVSRRSTRARNRLRVPLSRPAGGNILLVKLINQV